MMIGWLGERRNLPAFEAAAAEIVRFHRSRGASMVYVTHDQTEAMTMGDRIAVLAPLAAGHAANLMQYGTPDEVYNRPANLFVARFIGTPRMNVVTLSADGGTVRFGDQRLAVPHAAEGLASVLVGQRPEHLRIATEGAGLAGVVEHIENLGHEATVTFGTAHGPVILRQSRSSVVPALGARDPEHLHIFDPKSELRIG